MMRRSSGIFVLACLGVASAAAPPTPTPTPAATGDGDLDAVMSLLARRSHGTAEFVEQKFMAMIDHPIESSGELRYDAPDHLEKRTLLPRAEDLIFDAGLMTMERGGRRRTVDLHRYPQILPFIESIRATLAGDRGALEKTFHVEFSGGVRRWNLRLVPLDGQLLRTIQQVGIEGSADQLLRVEIRQSDGDRSLMTLRAPAAP